VVSTEYESPHAIQLRAEEIAAAVRVATDSLTYVAAHAHAPDGILNAVEAGCRSIEHTVYGNESVYRLMAERGTFLVPTVCTSPAMLSDPGFAARVTPHMHQRLSEIHGVHVENIKLAHRVGVKIAMGSDAGTPGNHCGDNLQELEVMVEEAGFSSLEAIQAATITAAELMRVDKELGSIEVGKTADIVAVTENPLDNISTLRSVPFVMKEGRIVKNQLPAAA
jgi:imidazolonepropionase-like amidohydrolase